MLFTSVVCGMANACGYANGTGLATNNVGTNGNYWSSSEVTAGGQNAFNWNFNSNGNLNENTNAKTNGFSVRPFRSQESGYRRGGGFFE